MWTQVFEAAEAAYSAGQAATAASRAAGNASRRAERRSAVIDDRRRRIRPLRGVIQTAHMQTGPPRGAARKLLQRRVQCLCRACTLEEVSRRWQWDGESDADSTTTESDSDPDMVGGCQLGICQPPEWRASPKVLERWLGGPGRLVYDCAGLTYEQVKHRMRATLHDWWADVSEGRVEANLVARRQRRVVSEVDQLLRLDSAQWPNTGHGAATRRCCLELFPLRWGGGRGGFSGLPGTLRDGLIAGQHWSCGGIPLRPVRGTLADPEWSTDPWNMGREMVVHTTLACQLLAGQVWVGWDGGAGLMGG